MHIIFSQRLKFVLDILIIFSYIRIMKSIVKDLTFDQITPNKVKVGKNQFIVADAPDGKVILIPVDFGSDRYTLYVVGDMSASANSFTNLGRGFPLEQAVDSFPDFKFKVLESIDELAKWLTT